MDMPRPRSNEQDTPLVEARLRLIEELLVTDDIDDCARDCVEWLAHEAGAERVLCAAVPGESGRMVALAAYGFERSAVADFSIDLAEPPRPLQAVLHGEVPFTIITRREMIDLPEMGLRPSLVVPFGATSSEPTMHTGLLLVAPVTPTLTPHACWVGRVFGERLIRLRMLELAREADRRIHRERGTLYNIINAVPDPILLTDPEGRMLVANGRAETYLVAADGESEGRHRAVALNNMLFSAALSKSAIDGTEHGRHELLLVHPSDGSDRLFELISTVVNVPGESTALVSVLRNVTDLRTATEELEENYRRLRVAEAAARAERDRLDLIIDSVVDPILVTDPSGAIVHMNLPAERIFTARAEEHGEDAVRMVRANDALFSSFLAKLLIGEPGERLRGELLFIDPQTGAPMPMEAISGLVTSDQGEVTAFVTILHDRREALEKAELYEQLKRASAELEQKVRGATAELVRQNELLQRQAIELERASALKSQFLANMSHEFRTPLNAILGYTNMLLEGVYGELVGPHRKGVSRIETNAKHLLGIINDILDIAKIEAGKMPLHLERFALADLLLEVVAQVEPLKRDGLALVTSIPKKLPSIHSDRQKVRQIILNLLTNALKFTPCGEVRTSIALDASTGTLQLAVSDTGIGIAPEDHARIFEDFRQVDSSLRREYGGTGLGLSICRRLATMLGGDIELVSALGQGSTFTLLLPKRPRRRS